MTQAVLRPSIALLVAISALQPIALNILAPATPVLARHFQTNFATIQLSLTIFLIAVALSQLVIGPLSDRYGRRPCIIGGIVLYIAGSVWGAFTGSTQELILSRMLEGVGGGTAFALTRAIIRDTADRNESARLIATVTMVMVIAPMLSPFVGGHIVAFAGWRAVFWFMAGSGALVLVYTVLRLHETAPAIGTKQSFLGVFRAFPELARNSDFTLNVVAVAATSAAFFGFVAAAPYIVVETMQRSPDVYGAFFIVTAFGYICGNYATTRLVARLDAARTVRLGLVISLAGTAIALGLALLPGWSPYTLFLPLVLNSFGNGMTIPSGTAEALSARPELAGSAAGLSGALQLGAGALASFVLSWTVTLWAPSLVLAMFLFNAAGLLALRSRARRT